LYMDVVTYTPDECPLCKSGVPVTKPGSRDNRVDLLVSSP
jgi:orotate phosphoribosyltransferase